MRKYDECKYAYRNIGYGSIGTGHLEILHFIYGHRPLILLYSHRHGAIDIFSLPEYPARCRRRDAVAYLRRYMTNFMRNSRIGERINNRWQRTRYHDGMSAYSCIFRYSS